MSPHFHRNPDGSPGGWVADSAHVADSAYVEYGAWVGVGAWVEEGAYVEADARVEPSATIGDGANVRPGAIVGRGAVVGVDAIVGPGVVVGPGGVVGRGAHITDRRDCLTLGPLGRECLHLWRTPTGYGLRCGCQDTTIDEARERLADPADIWPDEDPSTRDRFAVWWIAGLDLAEARVTEWQQGFDRPLVWAPITKGTTSGY